MLAHAKARSLGALLLLVSGFRVSAQDAAIVETVVRGVRFRTSAVTSLRGTAVMALRHGPRRNAELNKELEEAAAHDGRAFVPCDPMHVSLSDFSFDLDHGQWRFEMVDLTNNGTQGWATSPKVRQDRSYPPDRSYRASFCDGTQVYTYDRDTRTGWIEAYDGTSSPIPPPLAQVNAHVLVGFMPSVLKGLEEGSYTAAYDGEEQMGGTPCLRIVVRGARAGSRHWSRAWVAPGLGFAVLRQEEAYSAEPDERVVSVFVYRAKDLVEVADGIHCPRNAQLDSFTPGKGEGRDAWQWSRAIQCSRLETNTGLNRTTTLYPFPFDTELHDEVTGSLRPRPQAEDFVEPSPDEFGLSLTVDLALSLIQGTEPQ